MAELSVNFRKLDTAIDHLIDIEDDYDERISLLSDIKNQVDGTTNEFGYLSSASFQLSCKISELSDYQSDVRVFRERVEAFRDTALDEESGLANRLYTESYDFMQEMGITPEYEKSFLERGAETVIGVVNEIISGDYLGALSLIIDSYNAVMDWFDEHPAVAELFRVAGDALTITADAIGLALCIVALPVTGGASAIGIVGFGWALIDHGTRYIADAASLGAYLSGDEDMGDYLDEIDLRWIYREAGTYAGNVLNDLTGWDHFDEILAFQAETRYSMTSIAAFVCRVVSPAGEAETAVQVLQGVSTVAGSFGNVLSDIPERGIYAFDHLLEIPLGFTSNGGNIMDGAQTITEVFADSWDSLHDYGRIPDDIHETGSYFVNATQDLANLDFRGTMENTIQGIASAWNLITN